MEEVVKTDKYSSNQLVQIKRVRKFKGVHLVSEIVRCDGIAVDPGMLTRSPSKSKRKFPLEKPVNDVFNLLTEYLHAISSNTLELRYTLGDFKGPTYFKEIWHVNALRSELYLIKTPPPLIYINYGQRDGHHDIDQGMNLKTLAMAHVNPLIVLVLLA